MIMLLSIRMYYVIAIISNTNKIKKISLFLFLIVEIVGAPSVRGAEEEEQQEVEVVRSM